MILKSQHIMPQFDHLHYRDIQCLKYYGKLWFSSIKDMVKRLHYQAMLVGLHGRRFPWSLRALISMMIRIDVK